MAPTGRKFLVFPGCASSSSSPKWWTRSYFSKYLRRGKENNGEPSGANTTRAGMKTIAVDTVRRRVIQSNFCVTLNYLFKGLLRTFEGSCSHFKDSRALISPFLRPFKDF